MLESQVMSLADASLRLERLRIPAALTWRDMQPGLGAERIHADLVVRVCGREVRFPGVQYGFCFEPGNSTSIKSVLQALVALKEGDPHAWREGHGGVPTHLLQLSPEPCDRFEYFIYDDQHLYFGYHTNRGGMLSLEARVSLRSLLDAEIAFTERLVSELDASTPELSGCEERSRYLGQWEHLRGFATRVGESLTSLLAPGAESLD